MAEKIFSNGYFAGRTLVQQRGEFGGFRNVFVKLGGKKNELVFPTFGGQVKNPFKGAAKAFAGDLVEFRTDDKGVNPVIYLLKTYEVVSTVGSVVNIKRDGYRHIPFVGDILTIAPDEIGGKGEAMTIVGVSTTKVGADDVWAVTLTAAPTTAPVKGNILVECDAAGKMLVQNVNAVLPCDYDFVFDPNVGTSTNDDFDKARYLLTPALGGLMYVHKMSPMPACVLAKNTSEVNGWFKLGAWGGF